jgi:hypothetical protein
MESSGLKKKTAIIVLIILITLTIFSQITTPHVNAVDVKITSISPATKRGKVGDTVRVTGTINTTGGRYEIWFEKDPWHVRVANGTASENNVSAPFTIPPLPGGNYTLILKDVDANINATSWFIIETDYILKISKPEHPKQLQQRARVNISISITGGKTEPPYIANITVKTPAADEAYSICVSLTNTTNTGIWNATITYPFADVPKAHTNYTGTYTVSFNGTLASDTFFIGLTDSAEYHRRQTVDIKAVYAPYENVTLTIVGENVHYSKNLTADSEGIVHYNEWSIPENATIGSYRVSITSISNITRKTPSDVQNFTVPGFKIEICTRNLAGETVSDVTLKIHDIWANITYGDVVSNKTGFVRVMLEVGDHNFTAYYKGVRVNQTAVYIEHEGVVNITCRLTNLRVTIVSARDKAVTVPFVNVTISCNFTRDIDGKNDRYVNSTLTDIKGTAKFHSLLPDANHTIVALRYGKNFNQTIYRMEPRDWNDIDITCPTFPMHIKVLDGESNPIKDATVEALELEVGAHYSNYTDSNGNVTLNCIFGKYIVKIYFNSILLNETKEPIILFGENSTSFYCILYNLPIYVKVVDYFGQSIPKANVTLERNGAKINSNLTGADGIARFRGIGGALTIKVYLTNPELPEATVTTYIGERRDYSNPIVVKIGRYVVLAGLLVDTAKFVMVILILATIVLVAIMEIVRRKRVKPGKTSS